MINKFMYKTSKLTIFIMHLSKRVLQTVSTLASKYPSVLLAINFFILGTNPDVDQLQLESMKKAHTFLFMCLKEKMPYSIILDRMHIAGYECTVDDLIFWGKVFVDTKRISKDYLVNDLGTCEFSLSSVYKDVIPGFKQNLAMIHEYYPNTPVPYMNQQSYQEEMQDTSSMPSDSSSDMDITCDLSELYSLLGFMGTLLFSITFGLLIEYLKDKFDSNADNEQQNNEDDTNS